MNTRPPETSPWLRVGVRRFGGNPLLHAGTPGISTRNINGPTLMRTPEWLPGRLAQYYLYFSDHRGATISLALADELEGPWRVERDGVLRLGDTAAVGHIASPEILVDEERREVWMYFHGGTAESQVTWLARSGDGVHFRAEREVLAPFYLRVIRHGGWYYGLAKNRNASGVLMRSRDGQSAFERGPEVWPLMRHCALLPEGDSLWVFLSRIGDCPEEVLVTRLDMRLPWTEWESSSPPLARVLAPEEEYEGVGYALAPSGAGPAIQVQQLRDPFVYRENGRLVLYYTVAGEMGIAGAELELQGVVGAA